jgi:ABC-type transporter Mla MlaB component
MFELNGTEILLNPPPVFGLAYCDELREAAPPAFIGQLGSWSHLVVDLSALVSLDSAAALLLRDLHVETSRLGRNFMVVNCPYRLLPRLQLFRLHTQFPIGIDKRRSELSDAALSHMKGMDA